MRVPFTRAALGFSTLRRTPRSRRRIYEKLTNDCEQRPPSLLGYRGSFKPVPPTFPLPVVASPIRGIGNPDKYMGTVDIKILGRSIATITNWIDLQ